MLNQPSKDDVVHLYICQTTSLLYFDELSIFEYSKTEFSFQSVCLQSVWLAPSLSALHIARTSIVHTSCDSLALTMGRTYYGLHLL